MSESAKDFISNLLVVDPKDRMNSESAISHSWVHCFPPLYKGSGLFNRPATAKRNISRTATPHSDPKKQLNSPPHNELAYTQNVSDKRRSRDGSNAGLILPVGGEYQGEIISKEKLLEDCPSLMSQGQFGASASVKMEPPYTIISDCGVEKEKERELVVAETDGLKQSVSLHVADALCISNKLIAFPLALVKNALADSEQTSSSLSDSESVYDVSYCDSASNRSFCSRYGSTVLGNSEFGSRFTTSVGKVGDCYVASSCCSEAQETSFIEGAFDGTMSTDATYHSVHSLERFALPQQQQQQQQQQQDIPLHVLRSEGVSRASDLVYVGE